MLAVLAVLAKKTLTSELFCRVQNITRRSRETPRLAELLGSHLLIELQYEEHQLQHPDAVLDNCLGRTDGKRGRQVIVMS